MTDFNNLNTNENINTAGEERNIPSPTGILEEKADFNSNFNNTVNTVPQFEQIPPAKTVIEAVDGDELLKQQAYNPQFNKNLDPVLFAEKSKLKNDARIIGAAFLIMSGVIILLNLMVSFTINTLIKLGETQGAEILSSAASLQVMQIVFSLISFTLPFILIYKISSVRISDLMCFSVPKFKTAIPFFFFGISFCSFANIVSAIAASIFEETDISYNVPQPEKVTSIYGFLLAFISTVVVPAFIEEFACRGLMLGLLKKHGEAFAIIASSILFGLMHGNFEQMPFAFLVGLVLGFITVKSGTILIAIAVHAFNNFVSVAFDYILDDLPLVYQNIGYMIFLVVCLLLGIFAVFLFNGKDEELYTFKASKMKATDSKKMLWFFTSVPIIIYVAICLLDSLKFFYT